MQHLDNAVHSLPLFCVGKMTSHICAGRRVINIRGILVAELCWHSPISRVNLVAAMKMSETGEAEDLSKQIYIVSIYLWR